MRGQYATRPPAHAEEVRTPPLASGRLPLLGHAWRLLRDPLGFLSGLRDHGGLVRIKLGPKTVYAITAPALLGGLLKSPHFHVDGPLWESLKSLLGEGVATSNGPLHRRQRRMIQPAFRRGAIPGYVPVMEQEARALAGRWRPGEAVDITTESFRIAVRIMARCLLHGQAMDERAERLCAALTTLFRGMYQRMVLPVGPLYRLPLPANRRFNRALADMHRLVDEIIAERRATTERPDDLLTALLEATDEAGNPIGEQEVHDQVVAILTPGGETVGATLMWIFQLLTDYPEHARLVSAEVSSVLAGRPVSFADLERLPYTSYLVTEALRLRPAVWILTRRAMVDTELDGYRIPAGSDVVYCPYAMQRDPRSYERHLEFDPDRWQPERAASVPPYAMIPFGAGNRKCPADHFSMAQLATIVATVVPRWRFERLPESDDATRIGITLRPNRLMLRAVPR